MECGNDRTQFKLFSDQLQSTLAHFFRGFVGECHRQDAIGANPVSDQVRHAISDHASFPGACPGQYQQRPRKNGCRFTLRRIESRQIDHVRSIFVNSITRE